MILTQQILTDNITYFACTLYQLGRTYEKLLCRGSDITCALRKFKVLKCYLSVLCMYDITSTDCITVDEACEIIAAMKKIINGG